MSPVASLSHVRLAYRETSVLVDVSFEVRPGEACVLTGENGAGKSTIVRLMLGETRPDAGVVRVLGHRVGESAGCARGLDWSCVGYVPQVTSTSLAGFPATVREVLEASVVRRCAEPGAGGARSGRLGRTAVRARVEGLLTRFGLSDLSRHLMGELSGGQLQRVLFVRALVNGPRLLLLDEPTSGLDARAAAQFVNAVEETVGGGGVGVLLVTHDLARLPGMAHARKLRLEDGVVREVA